MKKSPYLIPLLCLFCLTACEEEFVPDINNVPPEIVVEGYIEASELNIPPYLTLMQSFPFYNEISQDILEDLFVHDAIVTIDNGEQSIQLEEVCLNDLDPEQAEIAANLFGFDPDSLETNFCVYIDLSFSMQGEIGKTYNLTIETGDKILTATTKIPTHVPLDSMHFDIPQGNPSDTAMELLCHITDPDSITTYYRYATQINDEPFIPGFNSVVDDSFFDGQEFMFPMQKGEPRTGDFSPETFGYFFRGDTATIKWATIDLEHYNFWNTLEFNAVNQGPFSSYTLVESNIDGGLGIWGGLAATYTTIAVPE